MFLESTQIVALLMVASVLGGIIGWLIGRRGYPAAGAGRAEYAAGAAPTAVAPVTPAEPRLISDPAGLTKDDLTDIIGIDSLTAKDLNALGIYTIAQIAAWSRAHALWVEDRLAAPDRLHRERWIEQAIILRDAHEAA